jgi:hypothetical protein
MYIYFRPKRVRHIKDKFKDDTSHAMEPSSHPSIFLEEEEEERERKEGRNNKNKNREKTKLFRSSSPN